MRTLDLMLCISVTILPFVAYHVSAMITEDPMDDKLASCLERETRNMTVQDFPSAGIMKPCIEYYLAQTMSLRFHHNVTEEGLAWIQSLVRKYSTRTRQKRQVGPTPELRVRREIRTLTDAERDRLFSAINALKASGRYDTLASFHQGMAISSAHNGPNFLSWHRIFCLSMEEALLEVDPTVTLAYWDSSIDFDSRDPIRSVVWTSRYFGNGDGIVVTGPFAGWELPDGARLTRGIGAFGTSLMQKRLMANVIGLRSQFGRPLLRTQEVTVLSEETDVQWLRANIIERQHDGTHSWVGGQMNGLATSAFDPVFFFHHCFIDYFWEQFREKQIRFNIDPSTDYPEDFLLGDNTEHYANSIMVGFPDYRNIDGFDNRFTRDIYTYARSPSCPNCGSGHLYCQWWTWTCVSIDRSMIEPDTQVTSASGNNPMAAAFGGSAGSAPTSMARAAADQQGPLQTGPTFQSSFADPRAQNRPVASAPRADGLGMAFGANSDLGTGTGINFGTHLSRTAERRGQFTRAARFGAMQQAASRFGAFQQNQGPLGPPQQVASQFGGSQQTPPQFGGAQQLASLFGAGRQQPALQPGNNQQPVPPFSGAQQSARNFGFSNSQRSVAPTSSAPFSGNLMESAVANPLMGFSSPVPDSSAFGASINPHINGGRQAMAFSTATRTVGAPPPGHSMPFKGSAGSEAPLPFAGQHQFSAFNQNRQMSSFEPGFSSAINMGIQNTFAMDGRADINRWAFMPVRIVRKRPPGSLFDGHVIKNGEVLSGIDMYSPGQYSSLKRYLKTGSPATYPKCSHYKSGAAKVFVEVNGVNFAGNYKDFALIDERMPVTEGYTYVGFRNPALGRSRAYVHAYDSSGRMCQPRCLVRNSNPPVYKPCSGAINVDSALPKMYGNTYGEAVYGRWDFKSDSCPKSYNGEVYMTFYCDYENAWPWRDCKKSSKKLGKHSQRW